MTCNATAEHLQCTACSLHQFRQNVVPGHGDYESAIAIVGEAPGKQEDEQGLPFVGPAGKLLDKLLTIAGIDIDSVWKTNVVDCRPPNNAIREYPDALVRCPDLWLHPELEGMPNLRCIVALGATAGTLWFPGMKAGELATMARTLSDGVIVVGSYHPSYVLRGGGQWVSDSIVDSLRRASLYAQIKEATWKKP
mgnify:CR=1 FL=1